MYPWLMALQSESGMGGTWASLSFDATSNASSMMPTCGPLPWVTTTLMPSFTMWARFFDVFSKSFSCSPGVSPKALPPRATTTRLPSSSLCNMFATPFSRSVPP